MTFTETLQKMPPLKHYDGSPDFDSSKSELMQWVLQQPKFYDWAWEKMRATLCMKKDHSTGKWIGCHPPARIVAKKERRGRPRVMKELIAPIFAVIAGRSIPAFEVARMVATETGAREIDVLKMIQWLEAGGDLLKAGDAYSIPVSEMEVDS